MVESVIQSHAEIVVGSTEKSKIRVLHVDDEPDLLRVTKQCLELEGMLQVDSVSSVKEALAKFEKERYDAVVSDYQMPGKDGLEFLKELRESGNSVPFIMFTGKGREEVAIRALNLGANQYLNKTGETETVYTELAHTITELVKTKKAERLLRLSEERYRNLFENAKDVIILFDLKGNVTSANKGAEEYGFNKSGMLGKNMLKFVSKKHWPKLLSDVAQIALGKTAKGKIDIHTPKGDKIAEYRSNPIFSDNRVVGIQTILKDTTERKKAEGELRESEERYNVLIENINDAFFAMDKDFRYTDWNKASERLTGIPAKGAIGKSLTEVFPDVKGTKVEQFYQNTLRKNRHQTFVNEYRMGDKDFVFEIDAYPTKDGLSVFVKDISERKKTEEALRESEEKYRDLFENAMDAIITLDLKGNITAVNNSALRFGYKKEELVGKNILDFVSKEYWPAVMRDFSKVTQGESAKNETELIVPAGKILVEYHAGAIEKENNVTGVQINIRDVTERKKAEELLRESEERFRCLFESIQDPVGIFVGREGRIIDYNTAFKKSSGYTDEELKGRVFLDFVHPDDCAMVLEKYRTEYSEGEFPLVYEIRGLNKKGGTVPLELSVSPYKKKGKAIGIEVIHRDLTERKKAEQALRESEERLRTLFENAPDAFYVNDLGGHFIDGNKAAEEMTGYQKGELIGKSFLQLGLLPKKQVPTAAKLLTLNALGRSTGPDELALNRKDGTQIVAEIRTVPTKIDGKAVVLGIARDITERKKNERLVSESQQKFKGLFMGNPEAAAYLDPDYRIQDINPRFKELFGYSLADVQGKHINNVVVPDDRRKEGEALDKEAKKGYVHRNTVRRKKNGSLVQVSVSAAPITVGDKIAGVVAMYHDISDLKNAEKKLDAMNEKLRVVGSLTRHDVRNKLAAVTGNAYLLRKRRPDDPDAIESLRSMETAVRECEGIFDFASAYEKLGVEELAYVDAKKTLDEAVALFPDLRGIRIVNECDGLTLLADSLLRQLFYNLIDDSLKYGGKLTQIRIRYEKSEGKLRLVYEDDGVGISQDAKHKLFKEGYTTGKGSGYGLYLIKRMMDVYGWAIDETGVPGKGAQFTISIPKAKPDGRQNYRLS
jgi:PAS domain S-box-containing protein